VPRFRCDACKSTGTLRYAGRLACPRCGSPEIQIALAAPDGADGAEFLAAVCVPGPRIAE
jgi:uncharacterized Zn finger protein (UPF0148 family)